MPAPRSTTSTHLWTRRTDSSGTTTRGLIRDCSGVPIREARGTDLSSRKSHRRTGGDIDIRFRRPTRLNHALPHGATQAAACRPSPLPGAGAELGANRKRPEHTEIEPRTGPSGVSDAEGGGSDSSPAEEKSTTSSQVGASSTYPRSFVRRNARSACTHARPWPAPFGAGHVCQCYVIPARDRVSRRRGRLHGSSRCAARLSGPSRTGVAYFALPNSFRRTAAFLSHWMPSVGLSSFGHASWQFMMVWQRYTPRSLFQRGMRSRLASSRESTSKR